MIILIIAISLCLFYYVYNLGILKGYEISKKLEDENDE